MTKALKQAKTEAKGGTVDWQWMLIGLLWVVFSAAVYLAFANDDTGFALSAYEVYHEGGQAIVDGTALYNGTAGWIYLYPPLTAQALIPIVQAVDYRTAATGFLFFNIALLLGTLYLLSHYIPARYAKLLWVAPIFYLPMYQALYIGQITILMLALLAAAWAAVRAEQRSLAGALLALAAWIKVFPAALVLYFLIKRDWRVIRGVALAGFALLGLQVLISGPGQMLDFFGILFQLTAGGQPDVTFENNSIFAFASRLFQENPRVIPLMLNETLYTLTRLSLTVLVVLGALITVVFAPRNEQNEQTQVLSWRFDLEYGLMTVAILLFGSTLWISGMPPLLLVYVLLLRNLAVYDHPRRVVIACIASYVLITTFIPMIVLLGGRISAVVLSAGFVGVILLWGALVVLLWGTTSDWKTGRMDAS